MKNFETEAVAPSKVPPYGFATRLKAILMLTDKTSLPNPNALKGILIMLGSGVCISGMHLLVRYISSEIHPFEIAFFRNLFALLALVPWFIKLGWAPLRTNRPGLLLWRAILNSGCMLSFFMALSLAPLVEVTALGFTAPIYVTILAILFLGERVGLQRWGAIIIGFVGVLVILRPGFETIGLGQLLVLFSAFGWGVCLIIVKILGRTETSVTITAYMSIMMAPILLVPAIYVWTWPTWEQFALLLILGVLGGLAQMGMAEALRLAPTHVVMPVDFTRLLVISLLAYLAFGEVPDLYVWLGGVIIFGSTAFISYREHVKSQQENNNAEELPKTPVHG